MVPATGLHRGTIAGVYGDTGIFYSTDPETAYGSWQKLHRRLERRPGAEQLRLAGHHRANGKTHRPTTAATSSCPATSGTPSSWSPRASRAAPYRRLPATPIVDYADGRGNTPWGFASGVGRPAERLRLEFDLDEWQASRKTAPTCATPWVRRVGPWQRIQYPAAGSPTTSRAAPARCWAMPASMPATSGVAGAAPCRPTTARPTAPAPRPSAGRSASSPPGRPEYAWVKIKVDNAGRLPRCQRLPRFDGRHLRRRRGRHRQRQGPPVALLRAQQRDLERLSGDRQAGHP